MQMFSFRDQFDHPQFKVARVYEKVFSVYGTTTKIGYFIIIFCFNFELTDMFKVL